MSDLDWTVGNLVADHNAEIEQLRAELEQVRKILNDRELEIERLRDRELMLRTIAANAGNPDQGAAERALALMDGIEALLGGRVEDGS